MVVLSLQFKRKKTYLSVSTFQSSNLLGRQIVFNLTVGSRLSCSRDYFYIPRSNNPVKCVTLTLTHSTSSMFQTNFVPPTKITMLMVFRNCKIQMFIWSLFPSEIIHITITETFINSFFRGSGLRFVLGIQLKVKGS